jgi:protocatechuate 3,4-dioxygenase beta subunit
MDAERISRRDSLLKLGGLVAGASALSGWKIADKAGAGPAGVASGEISCVLAPEATEGPFYLDDARLRRNITEGRPGTPLALQLRVVDVSSCKAIKGAAVDVWHCDAAGAYSGTGSEADERFLRGVQRTNARGLTFFRTIYPGWYPGRTVHIHVLVHIGGNVVHTGQLYFPDALTDTVFRRSPYNRRGARDTRNVADSIYRNGGRRSTLELRRTGSGYVGAITMGVQRA